MGDLSPIPFIAVLVNSFLWTLYAHLIADITVLLPNATGIFFGGGCVLVYHMYAKSVNKMLYVVAMVLMFVGYLLAAYNQDQILGSLGCVIAVFLMGSPLAAIETIIKNRSTASLPFTFSLMVWLNAICWTMYGWLIADDIMVIFNFPYFFHFYH